MSQPGELFPSEAVAALSDRTLAVGVFVLVPSDCLGRIVSRAPERGRAGRWWLVRVTGEKFMPLREYREDNLRARS